MKKAFLIACCIVFACQVKIFAQSMTINNQSSCDVTVKVYAHDGGCCHGVYSSCNGLNSNPFTVASGNNVSFTDITQLASCTAPQYWLTACSASLTVSGSAWDLITIANSISLCNTYVNSTSASCVSGGQQTGTMNCCSADNNRTKAIWSDDGFGNITVTIKPY